MKGKIYTDACWLILGQLEKKEYEKFKNKINEKISTGKLQYYILN